jgi:hypothetical protein
MRIRGVPIRPAPPIDGGNYAQLFGEVVRRIGAHNPDWTDFNESDPGVTLVELFAFLADTVLWQLDEQKRRRRRQRVALLLLGTAGLAIWLTLNRPGHDAAPGRP